MKAPGELPPFDPDTGELNIVIETPRGSPNKYAYDEQSGWIRLKKFLPAGMVFPFDFGFVPSTLAGDGDPLDVLVINPAPVFPGCLVRGRILGVIEGRQRRRGIWEKNDRIVAVPLLEERTPSERSLSELPRELLREIETFFDFSHRLEHQEFKVVGRGNAARARKLVLAAALARERKTERRAHAPNASHRSS